MRYPIVLSSTGFQAGSRRIGRCARCHAPVLCDEDHSGEGVGLVHGACATQAVDPGRAAVPPVGGTAPLGHAPRRLRRMGAGTACSTRQPPQLSAESPLTTEPTPATGSRR